MICMLRWTVRRERMIYTGRRNREIERDRDVQQVSVIKDREGIREFRIREMCRIAATIEG